MVPSRRIIYTGFQQPRHRAKSESSLFTFSQLLMRLGYVGLSVCYLLTDGVTRRSSTCRLVTNRRTQRRTQTYTRVRRHAPNEWSRQRRHTQQKKTRMALREHN